MKKKTKIRLDVINVQSFMTSLTGYEKRKINGGVPDSTEPVDTCVPNSKPPYCPPANTYPQTECECNTLGCPSYICEETDMCG
jgi:hypothetical protein